MAETTRLSGIPRQRLATTAAQFAEWALNAHDATCRECSNPNNDTRCPAGERYAAATASSNDDIPGYRA